MKKILLGILLIASNASAQGPANSWFDAYIGGGAPSTLATDANQNAYALNAAHLTKYSNTGAQQWRKEFGSAHGFALAASGATCYVVGTIGSPGVSFGNGVNLPGTPAGTLAGYLVRLDAQGVAQWGRQLPPLPTAPSAGTSYAVTVDEPRGQVYSTGSFADNYVLHQTTALGAAGWAVQATGTGELAGRAVAVDPSTGDVYVSGSVRGSVQLGSYLLAASATNTDGFVARITAQGAVAWAYTVGGATGDDAVTHLRTDPAGNAYVAGYFNTSSTFGPGALGTLASSGGAQNIFVASYSAQGTLRWAERAGGGSNTTVKGFDYTGTGPVLLSVAPTAQTYTYGATTVLNAPTGQEQTLVVLKVDPQNGRLLPEIQQQPLNSMRSGGLSPEAFPTCVLASATATAVYLGGTYAGQYNIAGVVLPRLIDLGSANAVVRLGALAVNGRVTANKKDMPLSAVSVFPVPAGNGHRLNVQLSAPATEVRLINSLGQTVHKRALLANARECTVATTGLTPGRYTLLVLGKGAATARAILIE